MHVFIVYTHPSEDSFTRHVRDEFIRGLDDSGHTYELSDLYKMDFRTDISEAEYLRESNYRDEIPPPDDVLKEQEKINNCDVLVFIYPLFWTEAPAKLVGWFDRVWTYGFAFGESTMKRLKKALLFCVTGNTIEDLREHGLLESMKKVMLGDRIYDRAESKEMIVLDGTTKHKPEQRQKNWERHLERVYATAGSLND